VKAKNDDRSAGTKGSTVHPMHELGEMIDGISAIGIKDGQADVSVAEKLARAVAKMTKLNASLVSISQPHLMSG
jgi:hypothetical protein